jgi:hypothetical protein
LPVLTPYRLGLLVLLVVVATTPFWAPLGLRRLDRFNVERVEVVGTRIMAPHENFSPGWAASALCTDRPC